MARPAPGAEAPTVIIAGPNGPKDFLIGVHFKNGVIVKVDRAAAFLRGRPIADVVDLARRRGWRIELSDDERAELARAGDR